MRETRSTLLCATSCFILFCFFSLSPSFFLWEEWEEVIIQCLSHPPPPPPPPSPTQLTVCSASEESGTDNTTTGSCWGERERETCRDTVWKFIRRWRRREGAQWRGETQVMSVCDEPVSAVWNAHVCVCVYAGLWMTAKAYSPSCSLFFYPSFSFSKTWIFGGFFGWIYSSCT